MNLKDLRGMLNVDENQSIEFKEKFNMDNAGSHICAFLNSKGGFLIVENFGQNKKEDIQSVENAISKAVTPKALFSFNTISNKGINYLIIEVPAGKDTPFSYKNVIYIRTEKGTEPADIETIKDMIVKKQNEPIRWERRFSDAEFETDFDQIHFRSVIDGILKTNRIKLQNFNNTTDYLNFFSLYSYGKLTNACDVLFCKNPAKRLPQIRAKAALFANDKTDSTYLDMKNYEGPFLGIFNDLYNFIMRNTPTKSNFTQNSPLRQDIQIYPPNSIREGLINALVHRDYSDYKGSISVFIYPDRLEIWNAGEFPEGVTIESLSKGNVSILRNPDIAYLTYLQGFMERLGRGANLIKKECAEYGLPEPRWKSEKGLGVTLTFFAPENRRISDGLTADTSSKPADTGGLATDYDRLRPITTDLTKQEQTIVEYLKTHKRFVLIDIEKLLDIKHSRAREILLRLSKKNIIQKFEKGSKTYYVSII
ncbi:MAG: ATP-binding protein [Candidatus Delongbacteria bacterium]|jgi:ATP-dependent DNA helicase RecG|nr:ATP-binding protein [Candidatus Delongbacteria bacterium]